jgi:hypothetical protein
VLPTLAAATADATVRHPATGPYVIGALVIAIIAVALMVQLMRRMKRAKRP